MGLLTVCMPRVLRQWFLLVLCLLLRGFRCLFGAFHHVYLVHLRSIPVELLVVALECDGPFLFGRSRVIAGRIIYNSLDLRRTCGATGLCELITFSCARAYETSRPCFGLAYVTPNVFAIIFDISSFADVLSYRRRL